MSKTPDWLAVLHFSAFSWRFISGLDWAYVPLVWVVEFSNVFEPVFGFFFPFLFLFLFSSFLPPLFFGFFLVYFSPMIFAISRRIKRKCIYYLFSQIRNRTT